MNLVTYMIWDDALLDDWCCYCYYFSVYSLCSRFSQIPYMNRIKFTCVSWPFLSIWPLAFCTDFSIFVFGSSWNIISLLQNYPRQFEWIMTMANMPCMHSKLAAKLTNPWRLCRRILNATWTHHMITSIGCRWRWLCMWFSRRELRVRWLWFKITAVGRLYVYMWENIMPNLLPSQTI